MPVVSYLFKKHALIPGGQNGIDDGKYWRVYTQDGIEYRFGFYSTSIGQYLISHYLLNDPLPKIYSFYLDRIQDTYDNTISIHYEAVFDSMYQPRGQVIDYTLSVHPLAIIYTSNGTINGTRRIAFDYTLTDETTYDPKLGQTVRADFPTVEDRQDLGPGQFYAYPEALEAIRIDVDTEANDSFEDIRRYEFGYTYYTQGGDSPGSFGPENYHLMLAHITEHGE